MKTPRRAAGFTLLELMVVLVVMAILAALAFTSYARYGFRARRPDGQKLLMAIGNAEERYYALHNIYADLATIGYASTTTATSDSGFYTASVTVGTVNALAGQGYTATAVPVGNQARDVCGSLTLTDTGVRSQTGTTGNGNCW
ncbi:MULTISPECIES: type IV pilin protein [Luteibacter]|uniref:type IV pilin protein n=1 Tax=Luteibacter TaxID=242605 RepID=UPI00055DB358|nr:MULTISPECIES: type IV pilin protein [unclassified Luteibacter]